MQLSHKTMTDEEIVRSFTETRDDTLFITLANRYVPKMRRMLYTFFAGNREDIEDAAQEVLAVLYNSLDRFKFNSKFGTYFYTLSKNTMMNYLKKKITYRKKMERMLNFGTAIFPQTAKNHATMVDKEVLQNEARNEVLTAIESLEVQERELIYLRIFEEHSLEEIAKKIKCPLGTVKSRLHRIMKKLKNKLEKFGYN